jgi:hypothetical protein
MRWCALLALSACYAPNVIGGAPCDPDVADSCPRGQSCTAVGDGHFCSGGGDNLDAGAGDAPPDGSSFCLGDKLLGSVCLPQPPTTPLTIAASTTINTASTGPGNCHEIRPQPGGPSLCLIAATRIEIVSGATLRAFGPHPLVLFVAQRIAVAGTIDVASHVNETLDGKPVLGAGARTATDCNAIGVDGTTTTNGNNGAGGAAGGSFAGVGGLGGNGRNGVPRGNPQPARAAAVLVGGCPGGRGGEGAGGGGAGVGGASGGAVYLLAGESILMSGRTNASGAGGGPGTAGLDSSGGGGGGGSGGMIGFEAPTISISGALLANGGGGGGGGGDQFDRPGRAGSDPMAPLTAAPGGSGGTGGGGNGGNGSTTSLTGANAGNAGSNVATAGGGGGGGGGFIRLYGTVMQAGAMISPPPTP